MISTGLVDIGIGNVDSVMRALGACGGRPFVVNRPEDVPRASHLVLPGVGAFATGSNRLFSSGLLPSIEESVFGRRTPFLGICLGMQLLCTGSNERGVIAQGLGWIPGDVRSLECQPNERCPHVGWNDVEPKAGRAKQSLLATTEDFYFTHSFCVDLLNREFELATTPFAGGFSSMIGKDNVYGVQFHPEKSQTAGVELLRNFTKC